MKVTKLYENIASGLMTPGVNSRVYKDRIFYAWYEQNDEEIINDIIRIVKTKILEAKTVNRITAWQIINDLQFIASKICQGYKSPPKRFIKVNGEVNDLMTEQYNNLLQDCEINEQLQTISEIAWLFDVCTFIPLFNQDGKLNIQILYPGQYDVISDPNDNKKIDTLFIINETVNKDNEPEKRVIVWTKQNHYAINKDMEVEPIGNNTQYINPFGEIPAVTLRFKHKSSKFFSPVKLKHLNNYRAATIIKNLLVYWLPFNMGGIFKTINLKLRDDNRSGNLSAIPGSEVLKNHEIIEALNNLAGIADETAKTAKLTPDKVFNITDRGQGGKADAGFIRLDSNLGTPQENISGIQEDSMNSEGLDRGAILHTEKFNSGWQIMVALLPLQEIRQSQIPHMRKMETVLFYKIMSQIDSDFNLIQMFDFTTDAVLSVDFAEPIVPKTIDEQTKEWESGIKLGWLSLLDIIKDRNPDVFTDQEAEKILKANVDINKKYGSSIGSVGSIVNGANQNLLGGAGKKNFNVETDENSKKKINFPVTFPDGEQTTDYSCGAIALQSCLKLYGIEYTEKELIKMLNTDPEWGTDTSEIIRVAIEQGLKADSYEMTIEDVKNYIGNGTPVILDIQAWHFDIVKEYDYTAEWNDGHYVVAFGYDENGFIIDDPSDTGASLLLFGELEARWHDVTKDENGKIIKVNNIGIAIYGLPVKYKGEPVDENNLKTIG